MYLLLLFFAAIVAYPMVMMAVYLFSKVICNQQKEFSELHLQKKNVVVQKKKKLAQI